MSETVNNARIVLKNVRFAYCHVFEKDQLNEKYSARIILPKDHPQVAEVKAAIKAAAMAGAGRLAGKQVRISDVLHDGDIEAKSEEFAGAYYLNAKSKNKPGVVKANTTGMGGKVVEITDPEEFYSGCWGHASIAFFAFNTGVKAGLGCALNNVMKTKDGDYLGGRSSAESEFGDLVGDEAPESFEDDDMPIG